MLSVLRRGVLVEVAHVIKVVCSSIYTVEMVDEELLERKLRPLDYEYEKRCNELLQCLMEKELALFNKHQVPLVPLFINAVEVMRDAQGIQAKILVEGSQTDAGH